MKKPVRRSESFPGKRPLRVESLEDRRVLATITVTSLADNVFPDGQVTLREAVQAANTDSEVDGSAKGSGADTIVFDGSLAGQAIQLGGLELELTEALTIDATALAGGVTIDAQQNSRIFNITPLTGDFTLAGLTLTGGRTTGNATTDGGGAINSRTTDLLWLDRSTVTGNRTEGTQARGGAIQVNALGELLLTDSTLTNNRTEGTFANGGGIFARNRAVEITRSTLSGNQTLGSDARGGGVYTESGDVILTDSTLSGNSTSGDSAPGGGVATGAGQVTLTNSTVSGNTTTGSGALGGGIFTSSGAVSLKSSTVSENVAGGLGAGSLFSITTSIVLSRSRTRSSRATRRAAQRPTSCPTPIRRSTLTSASSVTRAGWLSAARPTKLATVPEAVSSTRCSARWPTTAVRPRRTPCCPAAPRSTPPARCST